MNSINAIGPIGDIGAVCKVNKIQPNPASGTSFADTLKKFVSDVNTMQGKADESIQKMASGEITDVHQVMTAVEEANVSFNMMMEIRNKVMDAYQEIMRMRI